MTPHQRKIALTAHVTFSVGWLGATACFLGLSVVGLASDDDVRVRAAYVAMDSIGWFVLVPLAFASLLTGLIQSVGTHWGLFRHYWVLFKLAINVFATFVLLLYMETLASQADFAAASDSTMDVARSASPALHAGAALILLLLATGLGVLKPRGMTRYGRRKYAEHRAAS